MQQEVDLDYTQNNQREALSPMCTLNKRAYALHVNHQFTCLHLPHFIELTFSSFQTFTSGFIEDPKRVIWLFYVRFLKTENCGTWRCSACVESACF